MSFEDEYESRYKNVIEPAIYGIKVDGVQLEPKRVDLSKTGDSILTEIMEGISHSQLVLADVSTVGSDSKSSSRYRNGNVMYEVGLALASRHPSEVLLVRDDKDKFLFDVSTIPHMFIDFTNFDTAKKSLQDELRKRLKEQQYFNDVRIKLAIAQLSSIEFEVLLKFLKSPLGKPLGHQHWKYRGEFELAVARLIDKGVVKLVGQFKNGNPAYSLTPLGNVVAQSLPNLQFFEDTAEGTLD